MAGGIVTISISALSIAGNKIMSGIAGKIVRQVVREIEPMIAADPDQGQHELADQDGSTNDRADQKKPSHGCLPRVRENEEKLCQ